MWPFSMYHERDYAKGWQEAKRDSTAVRDHYPGQRERKIFGRWAQRLLTDLLETETKQIRERGAGEHSVGSLVDANHRLSQIDSVTRTIIENTEL